MEVFLQNLDGFLVDLNVLVVLKALNFIESFALADQLQVYIDQVVSEIYVLFGTL